MNECMDAWIDEVHDMTQWMFFVKARWRNLGACPLDNGYELGQMATDTHTPPHTYTLGRTYADTHTSKDPKPKQVLHTHTHTHTRTHEGAAARCEATTRQCRCDARSRQCRCEATTRHCRCQCQTHVRICCRGNAAARRAYRVFLFPSHVDPTRRC